MDFLCEKAIKEVAGIFTRESFHKVLFVVDEDAYGACGADTTLEPILEDRLVSRFVGFELNPKLADVERGIALCRDLNPDVVIALGGGSAIDLGKLISSLSVQAASARDIITGREAIIGKGPPLIAIPTTAGTGSEATHFAVAYVEGEKFSVAHETLLPDYSIVDPELTCSLPAHITAATGLDAFCQAIESIWAVGGTEESFDFATEAVEIAVANIVQAVNEPGPASRMAMCRASHLAGKAINISKTTAPHALSYLMTSNFGIPHGIAVALTLGPMLAYNARVSNSDCVDRRGVEHVRQRIATIVKLLGATNAGEARKRFTEIVSKIGCPSSLAEAGITTTDQLQTIVASVNTQRLSNNPRKTTSDSLLELLSEKLVGRSTIG
ncbi:MAG: phosphonoacetaldehyde reductase [Planctomycetales bacterium]|jgi:alcohol dehydrogenase class IV